MKKYLAVIFITISTASFAQVQFFTGNKLKAECNTDKFIGQGICMGYITGVADSQAIHICAPGGVTLGQYESIVKKYLDENPAQLHKDADVLVLTALKHAFPCQKR